MWFENGGSPRKHVATSELYTNLQLYPSNHVRRLMTIDHNQRILRRLEPKAEDHSGKKILYSDRLCQTIANEKRQEKANSIKHDQLRGKLSKHITCDNVF